MNASNSRESNRSNMKWYAVGMIAAALICPLKGAAQSQNASQKDKDDVPFPAQIVALDECDPVTFNADPNKKVDPGVGADFCRNVALLPQRRPRSLHETASLV